MGKTDYRALTAQQVKLLETNRCSCTDWNRVGFCGTFDPSRFKNAHFSGDVVIGCMDNDVVLFGGVVRKTGIYNAAIHNSRIGNNVYINNVENYIANYDIGDNVVIEHLSMLAVDGQCTFGNGVEVAVVNETGGREVPIFDNLSSHIAYIVAMYRHRGHLVDKLKAMIAEYVNSLRSPRGLIGNNTRIVNCGVLKNLRIGPSAVLENASLLENGSVNSCDDDPAFIGTNVIARDFIISSAATVTDGAIIYKCFVGQGCQLSRQYSAQNSLFFANCIGSHGEACSLFAGPYTVTHHKSTLLIAGLCSFLNAGSGSNQSNHAYKLGPVHQGILERGSKTTSDSYILWPARVGAFSLVIGRHTDNCDTSDLPFSYLLEHQDQSILVPGVNLRSVGTIRDWRKWPSRDMRKSHRKLDLIIFNLLTPYTVQKMTDGLAVLVHLKQQCDQRCEEYYYKGARIKRSSLENGIRYYRLGIDRYLGNACVQRLRGRPLDNPNQLRSLLAVGKNHGRGDWRDIGGLIAPTSRIEDLLGDIEDGRLSSLEEVTAGLLELYNNFELYEWSWVAHQLEMKLGKSIGQFSPQDLTVIIGEWIKAVEQLDVMRLDDAAREFSETSRIGFGVDGRRKEQDDDFEATRGSCQTNSFITDMKERLEEKKKTAAELIAALTRLIPKAPAAAGTAFGTDSTAASGF